MSGNFQLNQLIKGLNIVKLTAASFASAALALSLTKNRRDQKEKGNIHDDGSDLVSLVLHNCACVEKRSLPNASDGIQWSQFDGS